MTSNTTSQNNSIEGFFDSDYETSLKLAFKTSFINNFNNIKNEPVSPTQFKIFRFIFGIYLMWHFYSLINYGPELFSNIGMISNPNMNPTWNTWVKYIPSSFIPQSANSINDFLNIMVISSFLFAFGLFYQSINSIILWYGWAFLFNRNNFIANPGLPYVGWLLLACAIIPNPGSLFKPNKTPNNWQMPPLIFWSAWFLMAFGYTISGIHKLQCETWRDGSALLHVLESLLARDNLLASLLIKLMDNYPWFMKFNTWSSLFLEISFLPLGIFDRLRFTYWIGFMIMHLGILCLIDFTDLTLGVMMIHLFTFDKRWLQL